jgi:hypothetical protein
LSGGVPQSVLARLLIAVVVIIVSFIAHGAVFPVSMSSGAMMHHVSSLSTHSPIPMLAMRGAFRFVHGAIVISVQSLKYPFCVGLGALGHFRFKFRQADGPVFVGIGLFEVFGVRVGEFFFGNSTVVIGVQIFKHGFASVVRIATVFGFIRKGGAGCQQSGGDKKGGREIHHLFSMVSRHGFGAL